MPWAPVQILPKSQLPILMSIMMVIQAMLSAPSGLHAKKSLKARNQVILLGYVAMIGADLMFALVPNPSGRCVCMLIKEQLVGSGCLAQTLAAHPAIWLQCLKYPWDAFLAMEHQWKNAANTCVQRMLTAAGWELHRVQVSNCKHRQKTSISSPCLQVLLQSFYLTLHSQWIRITICCPKQMLCAMLNAPTQNGQACLY